MRWTSFARAFAIVATQLASGAEGSEVEISGPAEVLDGDTLAMGPFLVRLHGIAASESWERCQYSDGEFRDCGKQATLRLEELIDGNEVVCSSDKVDNGRFNRPVARCFAAGNDLGAILVSEGFAKAYLDFSDDYASYEEKARELGLGIWKGPIRVESYGTTFLRNCPIKGNINNGARLYHVPGSPSYEATKIDERMDERWFCDETEAQAAGWQRAHSP